LKGCCLYNSFVSPLAIELESTFVPAIEPNYVVLDPIVTKRDIELSKKEKGHIPDTWAM
jgi:hypothetical protein